MGGLFGGGSSAPSGPSQAELDAQAERERRASEKENEEKRKLASRNIARGRARRNEHGEEPRRCTIESRGGRSHYSKGKS